MIPTIANRGGSTIGTSSAGVVWVSRTGSTRAQQLTDIRKMRAAFDTAYPRVFVYFNIRRRVFSIRAVNGDCAGRVIAHAKVVELGECTFRVNEAGRQRVIATGRKNVHAGVVGMLGYYGDEPQPVAAGAIRFTYAPATAPLFVAIEDGLPVRAASRVVLSIAGGSYAEGRKVCHCGGFVQGGSFVHAERCPS